VNEQVFPAAISQLDAN